MDSDNSEMTEGKTYPQVTVYTSNDCVWCPRVKEYLSRHGVPYSEKNVEDDEATAMEAFNLAGRRQTPIIAVGQDVVVGFQRPELDRLLGLGASGTAS